MKRLLVKLGFRIGDPYDWEPTPLRRVILWAHRFRRKANATCNLCGYRGIRTRRGKWCPDCEVGELVRAAGGVR